jgi:hypothetical protein
MSTLRNQKRVLQVSGLSKVFLELHKARMKADEQQTHKVENLIQEMEKKQNSKANSSDKN